MAKPARGRRKFGFRTTDLRGRPAREANSEASSEDERELNRLLALINGRSGCEFDSWGARRRVEGKSRD